MGDFILGSVGVDIDIATSKSSLQNKIDSLSSDIAIIIDGNQTTHTGGAAIGEFVLVRNSTISGITDGLYKATQAIPANTAITSAYLSAVDGGGLNELNGKINNKSISKALLFSVEQSNDYSGAIDKILLYLFSYSGLSNGESRPFICTSGTWDVIKGLCFMDNTSKTSFYGFNSSNILLNGAITVTGAISRGIWTGTSSG